MEGVLLAVLIWAGYGIWSGALGVWFYKRGQRRKDVKFLKELHLKYPGEPAVVFYSLEAENEKALEDLREQVRVYAKQSLIKQDWNRSSNIPPPPPPPPPADPTEYVP